MKLVPLFRFWGGRHEEEELPDELPVNMLQLPPEEQPTDSAEEDAENEEEESEEEEKEEEEEEEREPEDEHDDMLKVFHDVEEEYVDNSALVSGLEDVPARELLAELRVLAAAFGVRTGGGEENPDPTL